MCVYVTMIVWGVLASSWFHVPLAAIEEESLDKKVGSLQFLKQEDICICCPKKS